MYTVSTVTGTTRIRRIDKKKCFEKVHKLDRIIVELVAAVGTLPPHHAD